MPSPDGTQIAFLEARPGLSACDDGISDVELSPNGRDVAFVAKDWDSPGDSPYGRPDVGRAPRGPGRPATAP